MRQCAIETTWNKMILTKRAWKIYKLFARDECASGHGRARAHSLAFAINLCFSSGRHRRFCHSFHFHPFSHRTSIDLNLIVIQRVQHLHLNSVRLSSFSFSSRNAFGSICVRIFYVIILKCCTHANALCCHKIQLHEWRDTAGNQMTGIESNDFTYLNLLKILFYIRSYEIIASISRKHFDDYFRQWRT